MKTALIIAILIISGCAANQNSSLSLGAGLKEVDLGVVFIDSEDNLLAYDDLPQSTYLMFPVIPGGIAGQVLTDSIYALQIPTTSQFELDLASLSDEILPFAVPMFSTNYTKNLAVIPKETRMLRLGTFAYDTQTYEQIGPTGIVAIGPQGVTPVLIVYFDRAARISGSNNEGEVTIEYDVTVSGPGFVFLQAVELTETHVKITVHDSEHPKAISIEYEPVREVSA